MAVPIIEVKNLSKRYRLGSKARQRDTFVGQIGSILAAPLENIRKLRSMSRFKEDDENVFWALRDISFEVRNGEVLGIIGHNGAGKSTLLKILSRITEPSRGNVTINGRIGALLEVGTGFHPELTGRDNIYMNGTILGMTRQEIDRNFDEIVDFSGVEKHIDTPVKFYSSGMKVRLGFAVAAHLEPEILIIDEVLAVGDIEFQRKCLGKIERVSYEGRTVLFVSHDMDSIEALCNKAILLKNGSIEFIGEASTAVRNYLNASNSNYNSRLREQRDGFILECRLINSQKQGYFNRGDLIEIEYKFNDFPFKPGEELGLFIKGDSGKVLSYISAPIAANNLRLLIDSTPLKEGDYYLEIFTHLPNQLFTFRFSQKLSFCIRLSLIDLTRLSTVKKHGLFYLKHSWEVD